MVSSRGIEANPEKVRAVLEMQAPSTTKQLQQLTWRIAALNRFISRSTDKCLPFFKILRKAFVWSNECEVAFGHLKEYLANPPLLSSPEEGEIAGLSLAVHLGVKNLEVRSDSQVVVGHIQGGSKAKGEKMIKYLAKVLGFWDRFERLVVTQIPRAENGRADALDQLGSATDKMISASKHRVIILDKPSMEDAGSVMQIDDAYVIPEWARYVTEYLKNGQLPNDKKEARKNRMQLAQYTLVGNILYRRGYSLPLLKCLSANEAKYVLKEIHEGVCGSHSGGRMLAHKAVQAGYYWPTMNQESMEMVRRCDK